MFANKFCSKLNKNNYRRNKKCAQWKLLSGMASSNQLSSCMAFYGLVRSYMAFCGIIRPFYGLVWPIFGLLWQNVDLIGLESSFLAVIDPNSFGLVVFKFCAKHGRFLPDLLPNDTFRWDRCILNCQNFLPIVLKRCLKYFCVCSLPLQNCMSEYFAFKPLRKSKIVLFSVVYS